MLSSTADTARRRALPSQRFRGLFDFFSKCFSPFPHGTCSLSVSCHYLALDGVYHTALGCNPKQPDSPSASSRPPASRTALRIVTLSDAPFQVNFGPGKRGEDSRRLQTTTPPLGRRFLAPELFPLRSPLLRESWLVSFPPLIDMLAMGRLARAEVARWSRAHPCQDDRPSPCSRPTRVGPYIAGQRLGDSTATTAASVRFEVPRRGPGSLARRPQWKAAQAAPTDRRDAQPNVPPRRSAKAQCAFKDSMIH